jgi:hypothetical protein
MVEAQTPFSEAERERFHALLNLAAESPFEGERKNALAAADRLAKQHGMTMDDAAAAPDLAALPQQPVKPAGPSERELRRTAAHEFAGVVNLMDHFVDDDKKRREEALQEAYERGLDSQERKAAERQAKRPAWKSKSAGARRNPRAHAHVLLAETSMPISEIVSLTGLDVYEVVGMKLKLRQAAG